MVHHSPTVAGRRPKPSGTRSASAAALTPKEVLGMLRRHLWLVFFLTILGTTAGGGGWYLIRRYAPLYQAERMIKVLPPIETDPMEIVATQVQQDIQYGHRVLLANQIKSQVMLRDLLDPIRSPKVRATNWFRQIVDSGASVADPQQIAKAVKDLEKNLTAFPHREAPQIVVSMTCVCVPMKAFAPAASPT